MDQWIDLIDWLIDWFCIMGLYAIKLFQTLLLLQTDFDFL